MAAPRNNSYSVGSGQGVFAGRLDLPLYVPTAVGEAAIVTMTNSLQSVRPTDVPSSILGPAMGLADFSGGAANRWASKWGKHLVHGGGHAISDDASVYAVAYGDSSVTWERLLGMYDLRLDGTWFQYGDGSNSYNYFIWRGAASTDPANPSNSAAWALADNPGVNPREYKALWPGSCHSYDTLRVIPPAWGGGPQGSLIRHGSFAVGRVVSVDTFFAHTYQIGQAGWSRLNSMDTFARSSSFDSLRGRMKPYSVRGYRDMSTGNWVAVAGSVTGLPESYADNHWSEYHEARDIHVYITNTQAETTAGSPGKWAWWPGGTDNGTRNTVTWSGGTAPPNVAQPGQTGQASLVYIDLLGQLCYYTRADQDAYYLITVPTNPADAWSWTRVPITGAGRPSLWPTPATHVYRRWDWLPALKSISYIPMTTNTGTTINQVVLIRLVP